MRGHATLARRMTIRSRMSRLVSTTSTIIDSPPITPVRRRIDAFAPNNSPIGNITDQDREESDPNQRPHNTWARIRTRYRRVLAEYLGKLHA